MRGYIYPPTQEEVQDECLELTSQKNVKDKKSMVSEKEWALQTDARSSREDAQNAGQDFLIENQRSKKPVAYS